MRQKDPDHWLYRLDPTEWLAAARTELDAAAAALGRRAHRPGITHLRRAAGMAVNAVLWTRERPSWGRSYMDHITALASDEEVPAEVRAAAKILKETPPQSPSLLALTRPGELPQDMKALLAAANTIISWSRPQATQP